MQWVAHYALVQRTPAFRMADRLTREQVGRSLDDILIERRAAGQSFEQIARELYAEFGIEVVRQTLSIWFDTVEAERAGAA